MDISNLVVDSVSFDSRVVDQNGEETTKSFSMSKDTMYAIYVKGWLGDNGYSKAPGPIPFTVSAACQCAIFRVMTTVRQSSGSSHQVMVADKWVLCA